jgi:hypothetical protein
VAICSPPPPELGVRPDLQGRHGDDIVVAASDIELGVVGIEMHVARAPPDLDVVDHLVGIGVDDDDVVGLLVADEDQAGILGRTRAP